MKAILSIRGGGIRGIIPCCALMELERQMGGLTRQHIAYCAGTSTGALLTAAIAAGVPAKDLLRVYTERSKEIFTPRGIIGKAKQALKGYQYEPKNLARVLSSVFGPAAFLAVNDSPIPVMLTAVSMDGHDWYFVRDSPRNKQTTGRVPLIDAAVASASAPTYFAPWTVEVQGRSMQFFDGGAGGVANPAYQACVEAFEHDAFTPGSSRVIDLGTGYYPAPGKAPSGLVGTIEWVLDTLLDSAEDAVTDALDRHWPGIRQTYNPPLPHPIDMADLDAIPQLVEIGRQAAAQMDWKAILA